MNKIIGAGLSRNKGIKKFKGDFIAFCDADDLWNKNKLKVQIEYMKKEKLFFFTLKLFCDRLQFKKKLANLRSLKILIMIN